VWVDNPLSSKVYLYSVAAEINCFLFQDVLWTKSREEGDFRCEDFNTRKILIKKL